MFCVCACVCVLFFLFHLKLLDTLVSCLLHVAVGNQSYLPLISHVPSKKKKKKKNIFLFNF